jgi:hypothetical protein
MKTLLSVIKSALILVLAVALFSQSTRSLAQDTKSSERDLAVLSGNWWGISLDKFLSIARLPADEYLLLDHPLQKGHKVVSVLMRPGTPRWEPKGFEAPFFYFSPDGLYEIDGHYGGSQSEMRTYFIGRYGPPSGGAQALGLYSNSWAAGLIQFVPRPK